MKYKEEFIIILIFLSAFYFRLSLDGLYPNNPGNIKAADPMYYSVAADTIVETEKYGYFPSSFTHEQQNVVDAHPPLEQLTSAALTKLSGIKSWNAMYILICLYSALVVFAIYRLCILFFGSKEIGIIAAAAYVLPMAVSKWLYFLYIGMWSTVGGLSFFFINLWLIFEYYYKPSKEKLFLLGITLSATFLVHFPEMVITFPFMFFVLYRAVKDKENLKNIIISVIPLLIVVLLFAPKLYLLSISAHGKGLEIGLYNNQGSKNLPFYSTLGDFPIWILILAGLGLLQLGINHKKYRELLISLGILLAYLFIARIFVADDLHFIRQRHVLPGFIAILLGYTLYTIIKMAIPKKHRFYSTLVMAAALIILPLSGHAQLREQLQYQHLKPQVYDGLTWLEENTQPDSKVVFLSGYDQGGLMWSKRPCYGADPQWLVQVMQNYFTNQNLPEKWTIVGKCGQTEVLTSGNARQTGLFSFELDVVESKQKQFDIEEFDYLVFEYAIYSQEFATAVRQFSQELVNELDLQVVFDNNYVLILKNED